MNASAADLGAVHGLLARIFLKEADPELLAELSRPEIAGVLDGLQPGFAEYVRSEPDLEDTAAEFARLFLLPGGVSPYAVGWHGGEEGAVRADLEERITLLHEALDVRPADFGLGNVPSDHIGMLLALSAVAHQKEASGGLANQCRALYADWGSRFAEGILGETRHPLYRAAARLLSEVLVQGER